MSHRHISHSLIPPTYAIYAVLLGLGALVSIICLPPTSLFIVGLVSCMVGGSLYYGLTPLLSLPNRVLVFVSVAGFLILRLSAVLTILNATLLLSLIVTIAVLLRQK